MIDLGHPDLSVRRQCELLGLNRATFYYQAIPESAFNLDLMRMIDEQYTKTPFYGWPKMTAHLRRKGYCVNHKRVHPAPAAHNGPTGHLSEETHHHLRERP